MSGKINKFVMKRKRKAIEWIFPIKLLNFFMNENKKLQSCSVEKGLS